MEPETQVFTNLLNSQSVEKVRTELAHCRRVEGNSGSIAVLLLTLRASTSSGWTEVRFHQVTL